MTHGITKNSKLRLKWRDAINEEVENMEKNDIWRVIKKMDVPENRRLLGAKWVFKVKKNGVFKARTRSRSPRQFLASYP